MGLARAFKLADHQRRVEVAETSPAVLDVASIGRLIASLGQAARCVSLNHQTLAAGELAKWTAIGVLDDAGDALTLLGAALEEGHAWAGGRLSVVIGDEAVVRIRRCLAETATNVRTGRWSFGQGGELDSGVADRMSADLALLPRQRPAG